MLYHCLIFTFLRCAEWVKYCGNTKVLKAPTASLTRKYFICDKHFDNTQYYNHQRKRLLPSAVPNVDHCSSFDASDLQKFPVLGHSIDVFAGKVDLYALYHECFIEKFTLHIIAFCIIDTTDLETPNVSSTHSNVNEVHADYDRGKVKTRMNYVLKVIQSEN